MKLLMGIFPLCHYVKLPFACGDKLQDKLPEGTISEPEFVGSHFKHMEEDTVHSSKTSNSLLGNPRLPMTGFDSAGVALSQRPTFWSAGDVLKPSQLVPE